MAERSRRGRRAGRRGEGRTEHGERRVPRRPVTRAREPREDRARMASSRARGGDVQRHPAPS